MLEWLHDETGSAGRLVKKLVRGERRVERKALIVAGPAGPPRTFREGCLGAGVEDFVIVLSDPTHVKGLETLTPAEQPPLAEVLPLSEALTREWATDAHLVLYRPQPFDPSKDPAFRLTKGILPEIIAAGGDVLVHLVAIEWDTGVGETHLPWTNESYAQFESLLARAERSDFNARLQQAAAFYTTKRGARWLYRLSPPVSAREAEPLIRGLRSEFTRAGINVDTSGSVANWAQPFRLPKVLAGETRTSAGPFFLLEVNLSRTIAPTSITPVGKPEPLASRAEIHPVQDEQPTPEDVYALLWGRGSTSGRIVQSEFQKLARHRLVGREDPNYLKIAFDPKAGIPDGSRSDTIQSLVGGAVSLLMPVIEQDGFPLRPAHIYALFYEPVAQLRPDAQTPDWTKHLWAAVKRYWAEEDSKIRGARAQKEQAERDAEKTRQNVQEAASEWLPLPADPVQARAVLTQHAIVHYDGRHWIMNQHGRYPDVGVGRQGLRAQIELLGMGSVIPLRTTRSERGGERLTTYDEITEGRMINASEIILRGQLEHGGYLEFVPGQENPRLVLCAFRRRTDLEPEFSPDVDLWFRCLLGPRYDFFCELAGCWLAFERGAVPLMAFIMPSNSGKKLIMRAFMECLLRPACATGADLVGAHQANLSRSPFIFVNEGWPKQTYHQHDPADLLRALVTGDQVSINEKYQPLKAFSADMRIGLFANNERMLTDLVKGSELGRDDRTALAMRFCYFGRRDAGRDDAAKLFAEKGEKWTDGWIGKGEQSVGSKFTIAKHLLWLYEKYGKNAEPKPEHHYLLMPGDGPDGEFMSLMRAQSGFVPAVVEVVLAILRNPMLRVDGSTGVWVDVEKGEFAVTTTAVLEKWRESRIDGKKTTHTVSNALRSLVISDQQRAEPRRLGGVLARWHALDVEMLYSEAERHGQGCDRLDKIMAGFQSKKAAGNGNGNGNGVGGLLETMAPKVSA